MDTKNDGFLKMVSPFKYGVILDIHVSFSGGRKSFQIPSKKHPKNKIVVKFWESEIFGVEFGDWRMISTKIHLLFKVRFTHFFVPKTQDSPKIFAGQASRSFATKSRPGDLGQMGDHFGETWPKIFPLLSEKYNDFK